MHSDKRAHWETVYTTKGERDVSWFEERPGISLDLMQAAGLTVDSCVIDVGGGESRLIDALLAMGLDCLAVLDLSSAALSHAQARVGAAANVPQWIAADVTGDTWTVGEPMDIWHDRAVFHFLVAGDDRRRYVARLRRTLKVGGTAIIATFAPDGPEKCSGLPVARYSPESLVSELGPGFRLEETRRHAHRTPWSTLQPFQYSRLTHMAT